LLPEAAPVLADQFQRQIWLRPGTHAAPEVPNRAEQRSPGTAEADRQSTLDSADHLRTLHKQRSEVSLKLRGSDDSIMRNENRNSITRQLLSTEPDSLSAEIRRIRQFVTGQLCDIRKLLHTDVLKAKLELEKHVKEIRMVPQPDEKKGYYVAEGEWNLLGGYGAGASPGYPHFGLVAGAGFEPLVQFEILMTRMFPEHSGPPQRPWDEWMAYDSTAPGGSSATRTKLRSIPRPHRDLVVGRKRP
jgi:hypothetical protein